MYDRLPGLEFVNPATLQAVRDGILLSHIGAELGKASIPCITHCVSDAEIDAVMDRSVKAIVRSLAHLDQGCTACKKLEIYLISEVDIKVPLFKVLLAAGCMDFNQWIYLKRALDPHSAMTSEERMRVLFDLRRYEPPLVKIDLLRKLAQQLEPVSMP